MKKVFLVVLGIGFLAASAVAQKGKNQVSVGPDIAFPTGDFGEVYKIGLGVTVKGLYGIGEAGQITFTTGYVSFGAKNDIKDALGADKFTQSIIPLLAGYRHNFDGFFVEPQIGYGIYSSKVKAGILDGKDSGGAFTWSVGGGYAYKEFEGSLRYQSGHKGGGSNALVGVRLAYNFTL